MYKKINIQPTSIISKLDVIVVHGGDNLLRAMAASIGVARKTLFRQNDELSDLEVDRVIIFSGAKMNGVIQSEANNMYDIFHEHLQALDESGEIPHGISIPSQTGGLASWDIRVGSQNIAIHIENKSVDTEDNAERSIKIIRGLLGRKLYKSVSMSPLSSDFHTKRIQEAFQRYFPAGLHSLTDALHIPISAEKMLQNAGGAYRKYGKLKEASISYRSKLREIVIRIVSRFAWGRRKIRSITQKRMTE